MGSDVLRVLVYCLEFTGNQALMRIDFRELHAILFAVPQPNLVNDIGRNWTVRCGQGGSGLQHCLADLGMC